MKHCFLGTVAEKEGAKVLLLNAPLLYRHEMNKYPIGKKLSMYLDDKKPTRSTAQNRLLWKYYGIINETNGTSPNDLHEFFIYKFLQPTEIIVAGEIALSRPSSKILSKGEFSEFVENIREFSQRKLDCYLPTPLEAGYDSQENYLKT